MIASQLEGVNFVVANTDAQALDHSLTDRTIQLGATITKGLGAGANPDMGRAAAEEAADEIAEAIAGSNMVFITAGMGGGTGTGAASVVARIARDQGVLTVAVVTKPFQFEGSNRMRLAESGLKELQDYVDTLIIIPNQNLFRIANERTTFADAFKMADEVLHSGVRGVTDLMVKPGLINLDFADIRTVMREMGKAMMGTGEATGERRAIEAADAAISNPLLDDVSLKGAKAALINITGGPDMTLFEVDEAANRIREEVDPDANIIFGSAFSDAMEGRMRVSVVATGIDAQSQPQSRPQTNPIEQKKPYLFNVNRPSEAVRPIARPAPEQQRSEPAQERLAVRAAPEIKMSASPAYEVSAAEPAPQRAAEEAPAPMMSQPIMTQPAAPRAEAQQPSLAISPRREARDQSDDMQSRGLGLFARLADVGRALAPKYDMAPRTEQLERNVQVSERPRAEVVKNTLPQSEEDKYLDIPAFLRRQAN
jgi:cell division protein FtsZ